MKIPKSFTLFASEIKIEFDEKHCDDLEAYGHAQYSSNTLFLSKKHGIIELPDNLILDTFYHEKVHFILHEMGEKELNSNEKFVDIFAKLLRQSNDTAKF